MMKEKSKSNEVLKWLCVFSIISIILIILLFLTVNYHSDCAGFLFFGKSEVQHLRLFPESFHFTTGIFVPFSSLFMGLFSLFIKNDYLVHELGTICANLLISLAVFLSFGKENKRAAYIALILYFVPFGVSYTDTFFFQGSYTSVVFATFACMASVRLLFSLKKNNSTKQKVISIIIYSVIFIYSHFVSYSNFIQIMVPALCAFILIGLMHHNGSVKETFHNEKSIVWITLLTVSLSFISLILYACISHTIHFSDGVIDRVGFIGYQDLPGQILKMISTCLSFFSVCRTNALVSVTTIKNCMLLIYVPLILMAIPLLLLFRIKKYDDYTRFQIIFLNASNFLNLFVIFICGMKEDRYFSPVYANSVILAGIFFNDAFRAKWKHYSSIVLSFMIIMCLCLHGGYYLRRVQTHQFTTVTLKNIFNPQKEDHLIEYLESQDLNYGYATFWYAYSHSINSNGKVTIAAYDKGNPVMPYYFDQNSFDDLHYYAVDDSLYDPQLHRGRCFVVVADGEWIPDIYYERADEIHRVDEFVVLTFNRNINEYSEFFPEKSSFQYDADMNHGYSYDLGTEGKLTVQPDTQSPITDIVVQGGDYQMTLKGQKLFAVQCNLFSNSDLLPVEISDNTWQYRTIHFRVPADSTLHMTLTAPSGESASIEEIRIDPLA